MTLDDLFDDKEKKGREKAIAGWRERKKIPEPQPKIVGPTWREATPEEIEAYRRIEERTQEMFERSKYHRDSFQCLDLLAGDLYAQHPNHFFGVLYQPNAELVVEHAPTQKELWDLIDNKYPTNRDNFAMQHLTEAYFADRI